MVAIGVGVLPTQRGQGVDGQPVAVRHIVLIVARRIVHVDVEAPVGGHVQVGRRLRTARPPLLVGWRRQQHET